MIKKYLTISIFLFPLLSFAQSPVSKKGLVGPDGKKIKVLKKAKTSKKSRGTPEIKWKALQELKTNPKTKVTTPSKKLKKIIGKRIKIVGFMMPLDFSAKHVTEFLLMPYIPSCMHVPPPPANQIIHVTMKKGKKAKSSYYPVEVIGRLKLAKNNMQSSFKMTATRFKEVTK